MFIKRNTKFVVLIILVMLFFVVMGFNIYSNYKYESVYKKTDNSIMQKLKQTNPNKLDIKLNNNVTYYNDFENTYYYYIDEKYDGKSLSLDLEILSNKKYNYIIDNKYYNKNQKFYIDYLEPIKIILYDNKNYFEVNLKFTSVPIINITIDEEITIEEKNAEFELYGEVDNWSNSIFESSILIRTRGASSSYYPKKSYRISLVSGESKYEKQLLGMRESNDWILDSLYNDYSKVRSKLAFELWNEINSFTVDSVNNDINMKFVDVYLNNQYLGLYHLKETVDRKKLGLEESSGILVKGINNEYTINYENDKKTNFVSPYEMKYPKNANDYSIFWDKIFQKINNFEYNLYNYIDYRIFSNVIYAKDNLALKNIYLSLVNRDEDTKLIITPWDLDMSFGYAWSGQQPTLLGADYDNYNKISTMLNSDVDIKLLINRYFELRETILSVEHVNSLIDSYYNQIKYSVIRDSERWLETDLAKEINDIKKWYKNRVEFFDEYLGEYDV